METMVKKDLIIKTGVKLLFLFCAQLWAVDLGQWNNTTDALLNEDIYTTLGIGQWTENFVGSWGVGSWVQGSATNSNGNLIWALDGPTIEAGYPSAFSDTNSDGYIDMIRTHYQGGIVTLYDAPGLWGNGVVFTCVDTLIEDHVNPFLSTYEYGFVWCQAVNESLGLTVNLYARVIECSVAEQSHSGELTELTMEIVPEPNAIGLLTLGAGIYCCRKKGKFA